MTYCKAILLTKSAISLFTRLYIKENIHGSTTTCYRLASQQHNSCSINTQFSYILTSILTVFCLFFLFDLTCVSLLVCFEYFFPSHLHLCAHGMKSPTMYVIYVCVRSCLNLDKDFLRLVTNGLQNMFAEPTGFYSPSGIISGHATWNLHPIHECNYFFQQFFFFVGVGSAS